MVADADLVRREMNLDYPKVGLGRRRFTLRDETTNGTMGG